MLLVRPIVRDVNYASADVWQCAGSARKGLGLNSSGLEVIVASPGRSGTTSVHLALEELGLRTYKNCDINFFLADIVPPGVSAQGMAGPLRTCGVQALVLHPYRDMIPKLIAASPGVKAILLRREWKDWARSVRAAYAHGVSADVLHRMFVAPLACHWLPYGLLWRLSAQIGWMQGAGASFARPSLSTLLLLRCLDSELLRLDGALHDRYMDALRWELRNLTADESLYRGYAEDVRRLLPPQRVLELDPRSPGALRRLAAFLGRPVPAGGEALPRTRQGTTAFGAHALRQFPTAYLGFWLFLLACAMANWLALRPAVLALRACLIWRSRDAGARKAE